MDLIGQLFAVEKQAKDVSVAERLALLQTQSVPCWPELRRKLLLAFQMTTQLLS